MKVVKEIISALIGILMIPALFISFFGYAIAIFG